MRLLHVAFHEAAHAVLGIRLNVPLSGASIRPKHAPPALELRHDRGVSGWMERTGWAREPTAPAARERLEALAVAIAGGSVAEVTMGGTPMDRSCSQDQEDLVAIARSLGIGDSLEEEAVRDFWNRSGDRAVKLLFQDDGVAWDLVTLALLRADDGYLSGAEIRAIVDGAEDVRIRMPNYGGFTSFDLRDLPKGEPMEEGESSP